MKYLISIILILAVVSYLRSDVFDRNIRFLKTYSFNIIDDKKTDFQNRNSSNMQENISGKKFYITSNGLNDIPDHFQKLYSYKDDQNTTVITQSPPPDNMKSEIIYFITDDSGISTNKPAEEKTRIITSNKPAFTQSFLKVYTPSGFKDLLEYSQSIGEKIEFRDEELKDLIEQL